MLFIDLPPTMPRCKKVYRFRIRRNNKAGQHRVVYESGVFPNKEECRTVAKTIGLEYERNNPGQYRVSLDFEPAQA